MSHFQIWCARFSHSADLQETIKTVSKTYTFMNKISVIRHEFLQPYASLHPTHPIYNPHCGHAARSFCRKLSVTSSHLVSHSLRNGARSVLVGPLQRACASPLLAALSAARCGLWLFRNFLCGGGSVANHITNQPLERVFVCVCCWVGVSEFHVPVPVWLPCPCVREWMNGRVCKVRGDVWKKSTCDILCGNVGALAGWRVWPTFIVSQHYWINAVRDWLVRRFRHVGAGA